MIKVLIIEDEQPAAKRLEKLLAEVAPNFQVIMHCDSIETSVQYLRSAALPDLIMLDIQLGDGLSFEIFKQVDILCPVIFTTAYDEFSIKAFELNSIDYLLKPINKDKLSKSVEKFNRLHQQAQQQDWKMLATLLDKEKKEYKQRFLVTVGEHLHTIQTTEIAYFYSIEKSTFFTTSAGKTLPLDFSLDKLEGLLSPTQFFRINRQFIVSFSAIKKIFIQSKSRIKLAIEPTVKDEVLVSSARTHDFKAWLDR